MGAMLPVLADAQWLETAQALGGGHWVANAPCRVEALQAGALSLPVTLLDGARANDSYVASPRSAWVRYARLEAPRALAGHPAAARLAGLGAGAALALPAALLAAAGLDHAAVLGNYLVSTNLHPPHLADLVPQLTRDARERWAQRPLLLRNVCAAIDPSLAQALSAAGWTLVPARMVYWCDPADPAVGRHNHVKKDRRLLADPQLELCPPQAVRATDLPALRAVFRQLFIAKHGALNPDFTPALFEFCLDSGFLELWMLRQPGGAPVGVLGLYARNGWLTTPLIGYDTTLAPELGVYRRLMALLLTQARERGLRLHYSSGAGSFKRMRGGQPALEWSALYTRHLGAPQRFAAQAFATLMQRAAPSLLARAERA